MRWDLSLSVRAKRSEQIETSKTAYERTYSHPKHVSGSGFSTPSDLITESNLRQLIEIR